MNDEQPKLCAYSRWPKILLKLNMKFICTLIIEIDKRSIDDDDLDSRTVNGCNRFRKGDTL